MIKLTELLKEEETFTAINKDTGKVSVFKSKDARDSAIKGGTHDKKAEKGGDSKKDTPKVNIFDKPKKDEPKKDEPVRDDNTDAQIDDVQNNIGDLDGDEMRDYAESDIFPYLKGKDLELAKQLVGDIEDSGSDFARSADVRADLKDLFDKKMTLDSPKEEPQSTTSKTLPFDDDTYDEIEQMGSFDELQDFAQSKEGLSDEQRKELQDLSYDWEDAEGEMMGTEDDDEYEEATSEIMAKAMEVVFGPEDTWEDSTNESSTRLRDLLPESIINEGTRSQVGVIGRNGKIVSAYVHYDGYPSNMKPGLKHHMKSDKDVLKLIKMGGARGIFDDKEIEYYKSGSPTKGDIKDFGKYVDDADRSGGAEYVYLYNMKDKKWYFADVYGDKKLKKLF